MLPYCFNVFLMFKIALNSLNRGKLAGNCFIFH
nr:MAG TPA: hypothetical protein [Caudoviricetes sp.]